MGRLHYPTAWVNVSLLLEDFGQPDPDRAIALAGHPLEFNVTINAFNQADTAKVTIGLEEWPLSPRLLRGGTVHVFLADAETMVDERFWLSKTPDEMRELAVFAGVVDEPRVTIDDRRRRVELKCRDYTAYFLDATVEGDSITYVEGGRKLSFEEVLQNLLDQRDTTRALAIDYQADVIYPADYKRRGDDPKLGRRRKKHGETVWEVVTELALEAGFVVYVDLDTVVVREPQTIFVGGGDPETRVRYVLGGSEASVSRLVTSRDLGRQHGINVTVTSYDPDAKRTLVARSPLQPEDEPKETLEPAKIGQLSRKKNAKKTTQRTDRPFVVRGISSQVQLQRIADQLREQLRHHEMEASIESRDMVDANGRPVQKLRYGDPVEIALGADLTSVIAKPAEEQVRDLLAIGYEDEDARSIALGLERLQVPFYVHRANHRFSSRRGYELDLEVRSRKQVDLGADRVRPRLKPSLEITIE